ncbi:ABC transporter permease [Leuconostoc litchii]|uniref:ABC transporter permease n=1 Tax=Leuconostoc litchii TaxID=1981069 RepID=A0A6P2CQC7_9LACO|nr:ABC transporter permease [Leuconostoc litchii]TYC47312.1 ABC transporter permease [Leuconostoc litchii]GMA69308.1 ABC transporter permease [Leuconostoc litchii]
MDFIKRAVLYLRQKIGRTALITLVMSAIMIFVLAGIIIQSAAIQATNSAKNSAGTTVTLSADREKAFASMRKSQSSSSSTSSSSSSNTAPTAITMPSVKIKTAEKIAALNNVAGYQYSNSASVNASGFSAVTTSSSSNGGQGGFGGSTSSGDITVSGVSTTAAESNFKSKSYKITSGRGITASDKNTNNVVIESELATSNNLKVGSTIKVKTTDDDSKTYTLTVVGIYKAKTSTSSQGGPGMSDPSNTIYSSYTLAGTINGDTSSVTSVVYTLTDSSKEKAFTKAAKKLISSSFSLTSSSETYALLMKPMKNVQSFANKIVWIVGIAGTIILALITVLMIRERRHEIGVLMALGESKFKIILQLFSELFAVLLVSLVIAGVAGNFVGNAVGKQLVSQQTTSTQTTSTGAGFGGGGQQPGGNGGGPSSSGQTNQTGMKASGNQINTLKAKISAKSMAELGGLGLGIIAVAVVAGSTPIFRLKPKKILSNE